MGILPEEPVPRSGIEELLQEDVIASWLPKVGENVWQTVYRSAGTPPASFAAWCALLTEEAARLALTRSTWDLMVGDGRPGWVQRTIKGQRRTEYFQHGTDDGIRPFVLARTFDGACPRYCEVIEEFRLFHNLSQNPTGDVLNAWDDSGCPVEVVRIAPASVEVHLAYLRQFQAATQLHLAIFVDSFRHSPVPLNHIPEGVRDSEFVSPAMRVQRTIFADLPWRGNGSVSRVLGKVILSPPQPQPPNIFSDAATGAEPALHFIVGIDADGREKLASSPALINRLSAATDDTSLTPVFFRREVLAKYYNYPERYTVSDGTVQCLGFWSCPIDNDHPTHVIVFLADLCSRLPYKERLHWREHNVPPEGTISETAYRRSFLVQFTDASSVDLVFRRQYEELNEDWTSSCGWALFHTPIPADEHLLKTIRIPTANSQPEFDQQVLYLAKLLIDHLNESALQDAAGPFGPDTKGIGKIEAFVKKTGFPSAQDFIAFLRALQRLRSKGAAHRKGSEYAEALQSLGLDSDDRCGAFRKLLRNAIDYLEKLRSFYINQERPT